jgi:hypothetical protein
MAGGAAGMPKTGPGGGGGGGGLKQDEPDDETVTKYLAGQTWIYKPEVKNRPPAQNRFFTYLPKVEYKQNINMTDEDIAEEIWINQENLWLQCELFKCLKRANDSVALFTDMDPKADGINTPKRLKNYYWEIELKLVDGNSLHVKLKNMRPYRQEINNLRLAVTLTKGGQPVVFPNKDKDKITFGSAQRGPAGSTDPPDTWECEKPIPLPENTRALGIFKVEQVLTWETAAVKRIDLMVIGTAPSGDVGLGHRLSYKSLLPYKKKKDEPKAPEPDPKDKKGGVNFPIGKDQGPDNRTFHGLVKDRYLEVSQEARKLPVSLVLIVDPDHMAHVQAALLDSPLRFLITQVMWQRFAESMRPPELPTGEKTGTGFNNPMERPGGALTTEGTTASSADEMENIELAIFGIVTIYERPGRPAPTQAPPPK